MLDLSDCLMNLRHVQFAYRSVDDVCSFVFVCRLSIDDKYVQSYCKTRIMISGLSFVEMITITIVDQLTVANVDLIVVLYVVRSVQCLHCQVCKTS
jgi:hypothetical protein